MKKSNVLLVLMISVIFAGSYGISRSSEPTYEPMFNIRLEPVELPDRAGLIELEFSFSPTENCPDVIREVIVTVIFSEGLEYSGSKSWTIQVDKNNPYSTVLSIKVPDSDTSKINVRIDLGKNYINNVRYFVTTGDLVEYWKGYPSGRYWKTPKWVPDTNLYEIRVDMRNSIWRSDTHMARLFEDEYGKLIETKDTGFFILKLPRGGLESLKRAKIKCEYIVEPPPWPAAPPRSHDRVIKRKSDSTN